MKRLGFLVPAIALMICLAQNAHAEVGNIPEPTSMLLLGSGIVGILGLWRRFK